MLASVQLQLQISYAEPVRALNQLLRLKPRSFDSQEVKEWQVDVLPDAKLRRTEDGFGNIVHSCSHDGPLDEVTITAEGLVETHDAAGVVRGLAAKLPLDVFLRDCPGTRADKDLAAFSLDSLADEKDPLGRMHGLMAALHKALALAPGEMGSPRPAAEVFASRAGADPAKVRQALMGGLATSRILELHGERMIKRTFDPGFRIELHQKDLSLALSSARALGVSLPNTATTQELFNACAARGGARQDHSALVRALETLANHEIGAKDNG